MEDDREKRHIIVCDRGFVLYGYVDGRTDYIKILNCACIRKWGTTRGLGQLGFYGPTPQTVLDPQPDTLVPKSKIIQMIECHGDPWKL